MSNTSEVRSDALVFLSRSKGVKYYLDWGRIVTIVETRVLLPYWKASERHTGTANLPRSGDMFYLSSGGGNFYFLS